MCAKRMLRAGSASDVIAGPRLPRVDERQGVLKLSGLEPPAETAEQFVERLTFTPTEMQAQARADLAEPATYRAYSATEGWVDRVDEIARQAVGFARQLAGVSCIRSPAEPGDDDAVAVNDHIAMITEEADSLISALIRDAEARGLQASGPWMKIPLVECRKFEVAKPADPDLAEADDAWDRYLNS
jgi:hypothetical protein